jgi:predicted methyltransferase
MKSIPLTARVHETLALHLRPGDQAIDATAGNGWDTLFLAKAVGPKGKVLAIDIQAEALQSVRERLHGAGLLDRVFLRQTCHRAIAGEALALGLQNIRAIVFNLGYLPGGNKQLCTQTETTLHALQEAWNILPTEGLLSVLCYPGHETGATETAAVHIWAESIAKEFPDEVQWTLPANTRKAAPQWLLLTKPLLRTPDGATCA